MGGGKGFRLGFDAKGAASVRAIWVSATRYVSSGELLAKGKPSLPLREDPFRRREGKKRRPCFFGCCGGVSVRRRIDKHRRRRRFAWLFWAILEVLWHENGVVRHVSAPIYLFPGG